MPEQKKFCSQIGSLIRGARAVAPAKEKPVAAFGEMVAVLWPQKRFTAAIELKKLWNALPRITIFTFGVPIQPADSTGT